jgi:hypothetical protein
MPPPVVKSDHQEEKSSTDHGTLMPSLSVPFFSHDTCLTNQPIWGVSGIAYGMVELIRRVIPADICGGDVLRLRRMGKFCTLHITVVS